jgi:2'-5' RNA ligase
MSRLFIGCPIDIDSAELIVHSLMPWQQSEQKVHWLRQEDWHVTLAFIGEVDDFLERKLASSMDLHLGEQPCLQAPLLNLSAFPNVNSAAMVAKVLACPALQALHQVCTNICAELLLPPCPWPYRPHITLARKASFLLPRLLSLKLNGHLDIRQVALYRSEVSDNGRSYRIIHQCALR